MRAWPIAVFALAAAACAMLGKAAPAVAPLESEGEIVVELQPLPPEAARTTFEVADVFAVRSDAARIPLAVLQRKIGGDEGNYQRMLARGRAEPGRYAGLAIVARTAAARPGEKQPEPETIEAPFTASARRATVVQVQLRPPQELESAAAPSFSATVPPRVLPQVVAYCTDSETHEVAVVDKLARQLGEVLPTGRGPWGVALDAAGGRAFVALSGDDQISVVDVAAGEDLSRIRLNLGDSPREVALTPDRRLLLSANAGSNTVSFIDPAGMIEVGRASVGQEPTAILVDRRGSRAYVTNRRSSSLTVLDVAARSVVATLATEDQPLRPQIDRSGSRLYVLHPASAFLLVFSLPDLTLSKRVYVGLGNSGLKVDPATDLLYVAKSGDRRIAVYDPFSLIPVSAIDALPGVDYMVIDDAQNALFALAPEHRAVGVVELAHKRLASIVDVGGSPRVLALTGERN